MFTVIIYAIDGTSTVFKDVEEFDIEDNVVKFKTDSTWHYEFYKNNIKGISYSK